MVKRTDGTTTLSSEAYNALNRRGNKYGAKPTVVDGYTFASKKEARWYEDLKLRALAGEITELTVHPAYVFVVNGWHVGKYTADFRYRMADTGALVVLDVKSRATKTEAYQLRKRLMWACHEVHIAEV